MQLQHWNPGELDFQKDIPDFESLPRPLQETLVGLLAFFAFGDGVVDEVIDHVRKKIQIPEVQAFYWSQGDSEIVHGQTYGDMIRAFVPDQKKQDLLLTECGEICNLQLKLDWVNKWTKNWLPLPVLLCAMLIIEQLWFSTAFNIINWLRVLNVMPEMVRANEFIIRNEKLHGDYAAYLLTRYFNFKENLPLQRVFFRMLDEAKSAETNFLFVMSTKVQDETEPRYKGLQFEVLYKHMNETVNAMILQLFEQISPVTEELQDYNKDVGLHLSLLTALGSGKDNFFEYCSPNYQLPLVSKINYDDPKLYTQ
ncbi:unnamed protein product [Parnassius mnemosyne]